MTDPDKIFDGLLVLQYRSGNKKALNLLVKKYHHRFCKHSCYYTHNLEASKDIVQDCWRIILNKLDSLQNPDLFGSWAFRIVTRRSLDYTKQQKRELEKLKENPPSLTMAIEDKVDKNRVEELLKAIKDLPKDQQVVLRLFYTEEYSLKEIEDILQVSMGTVKSRLFHAREKLKTILKK